MVAKTVPTKAQQIRVELAKLQAAGEPLNQKLVRDTLAARGVTVSSGHVSLVAKSFKRFKRSADQVKNGCPRPVVTQPKTDCEQLRTAADFARRCGGLEPAQRLLKELATLVDPFLAN